MYCTDTLLCSWDFSLLADWVTEIHFSQWWVIAVVNVCAVLGPYSQCPLFSLPALHGSWCQGRLNSLGRAPKAHNAVAFVQTFVFWIASASLSSPNVTLGVVNAVSRPGIFHCYLVLALKTTVCLVSEDVSSWSETVDSSFPILTELLAGKELSKTILRFCCSSLGS